MKKYPYKEARETIMSICQDARSGKYDTREKFLEALRGHPDVAAQGYNPFGKIFFWNDASIHLYGHSETAAVNQDLFELILPLDLRPFARDMVAYAHKTGKLPEASTFDLVRHDGESVTVFSGHLIFQWKGSATPEFYSIDLPIESGPVD